MQRIAVVFLHLFLDAITILFSFYVAYSIRFEAAILRSNPLAFFYPWRLIADEHFIAHFQVAAFMAGFLIVMLYQRGLYATERGVRYSHEFSKVAGAVFWTLLAGIAITFLFGIVGFITRHKGFFSHDSLGTVNLYM